VIIIASAAMVASTTGRPGPLATALATASRRVLVIAVLAAMAQLLLRAAVAVWLDHPREGGLGLLILTALLGTACLLLEPTDETDSRDTDDEDGGTGVPNGPSRGGPPPSTIDWDAFEHARDAWQRVPRVKHRARTTM
jgi:hypothetical protein